MPFGNLISGILDHLPLIGGRRRQHQDEWRTVYVHNRYPSNDPEVEIKQKHYADNELLTSKYTLWNFIPKNLFEQFRRIANFYFLCIGCVQLLIDSPVSPVTSILPLCFVITVTAIKQAYEDYLRHKVDNEVNNRPCRVVINGKVEDVPSKSIKVGDIVRVKDNEEFPCDLVVLSCEDPDGVCYITTANLDGETNLKVRNAVSSTTKLQTPQKLDDLSATVECQHPHEDLYSYSGRMIISRRFSEGEAPDIKSLGPQNLLLRGARLKNSDHVFGVAVYTGKETKMALNQAEAPHKFSTVEKTMNAFLVVFLIVLVLQAMLCTGLKYWTISTTRGSAPYAGPESSATFKRVVENFLIFLILYNYVIPISLYVTVELQKFIGALFFVWDVKMYNEDTDEKAIANTSDLNEELGQIEYIFTDKTGTLTENDMQFKECSINGQKYCEEEMQLFVDGQDTNVHVQQCSQDVLDFYIALSLCHTVQASLEKDTSSFYKYHYQASSPDEKALVEAAVRFGVVFQGKSGDDMELDILGNIHKFTLLHVLEFDSTRKRMSVFVKTQEGKYLLLTKGAETAVLDRLRSGPQDVTQDHVDGYAEKGLRTLAIAQREFTEEEYLDADAKLTKAQQAINDREEQLATVYDEVERDLHLLGATAVEDKLQDGVPETIEAMREAGIKVWVLTGDKQETAVNISHSCGHFKHGMDLMFVVKKNSPEQCEEALMRYRDKVQNKSSSNIFGLIVDGRSLGHVFNGHKELFKEVCRECVAVLCCRMSPLQKAQVVQMMKTSREKPVTLAIGDGANDCGMIQEAHVGIGVMGKEGRQAVMTSDYAISRFKFLWRALLVHGHYYYIRSSILVQYFFYKNVCFITPQFFYSFFNAFSGQPLYHGFFLTCYNIFFTSIPILVYGVFEQHLKSETLQSRPHLYKDVSFNSRLSWKEFIYWIASGYWHSIVFFFGGYLMFHSEMLGAMNFSLWSFGTFVFMVCVIVSNLKLALVTHYWTCLTHIGIWGSILTFFVFAVVFNSSMWIGFQETFGGEVSADMFRVVFTLLNDGITWLGVLLLVFISLLPDMVGMIFWRHLSPSETQKAQIDEKLPLKMKRNSVNHRKGDSESQRTVDSMVLMDYNETGSTIALTSKTR
ncbi:probable phospholipid-transporting ATPase IF isoform X2 [Exaiptasia diaphana]|uniref:Phospholipid-transporting ATPase n=1 Tax=Exaiptasia diaphana TaxID=2652724 RepID=A0A913XP69_EXADI|nr:probable phospholipid-transporting ATPase IF isoform X2 [Exaiptasia diaphana]